MKKRVVKSNARKRKKHSFKEKNMSIRIVPLGSLDKVFLDRAPVGGYRGGSLLRGENYSFQFAFTAPFIKDEWMCWDMAELSLESDISDNLDLYLVRNVPVHVATYVHYDHGYEATGAGMYPDPLIPLKKGEQVKLVVGKWQSIWVRTRGDIQPGKHTVRITLTSEKGGTASAEVELDVLPVRLPEQKLMYTNWFHCDCISDLHGKEIFSDEYWTVMESYMKLAGENGVNMILVPAFTPALDTPVGGERMTAQLVEVTKTGDKYTFGFDKLDRYIASAQKYGIKWFEHNHFFTQWGVENAPKVMATVDGEYKRIFGWDTKATGEEYTSFLHQYLDALIPHLKEMGIDDSFYYHISDEPRAEHMDNYLAAKAVVYDRLKNYHFFEALSHIELYKEGAVPTPVAITDTVSQFVGVADDLWTYYTGFWSFALSNRLISMASRRNRVIGMQMYKNGIKGFLHWGFNYYYNFLSREAFNPMTNPDAYEEFPAGTSYIVYPNGDTAAPSIRLFVFHDAIQDVTAMQLLESAIGHEATVEIIENAGGKVDWRTCPGTNEQFLAVREAVNAELSKHFG